MQEVNQKITTEFRNELLSLIKQHMSHSYNRTRPNTFLRPLQLTTTKCDSFKGQRNSD